MGKIKRPLLWCNLAVVAFLSLWGYGRAWKSGCLDNWYMLIQSESLRISERQGEQDEDKSLLLIEGTVEYLWMEEQEVSIRVHSDKLGRILLVWKTNQENNQPLQIGNRVRVKVSPKPFRQATVPGQYDEKSYYEGIGYRGRYEIASLEVCSGHIALIRQGLMNLRRRLCEVYRGALPEKESGILCAMVLGEKSTLDADRKDAYRKNGMSHLLAVSGLHVSLLGGFILFLLRRLPVFPVRTGYIWSGMIAILFVILYGFLIDYPISALRAIIMMALYLFAGVVGRTYDMPTALSCALLMIAVQNPKALGQAGTQLTFGAVAGILIFSSLFPQSNRKLLSGIRVGIIVLMSLLPLEMYHFYEVSLAGLWNNLLVLPALPLLLVMGLAGGALGLIPGTIGGFLARFTLGTCYVVLQYYESICEIQNHIPWLSRLAVHITGRPAIWQMLLYYGILGGLIFLKKYGRKESVSGINVYQSDGQINLIYKVIAKYMKVLFPIVMIGLAIGILCLRIPDAGITMLDVGQGDGMVIQDGKGHSYLVDGGSSSVTDVGKRRIIPYLKREGIRCLDGVFVSHTDKDHVSGIINILESGEISVKTLYLSEVSRQNEDLQGDWYDALLKTANAYETNICYLKPGDQVGENLSFFCLAPSLSEAYKNCNDASMVLHLQMEGVTMLLCGDIGEDAEDKLCRSYACEKMQSEFLQTDILKVAHHGSKQSNTQELLDCCGGRIALVSYGQNNRYGHPHEETVYRLNDTGYLLYGTGEYGTIRIKPKQGKLTVWAYRKNNSR